MFGNTNKWCDPIKRFGPDVSSRLSFPSFSQALGFFTQPPATAGLSHLSRYLIKEAAG